MLYELKTIQKIKTYNLYNAHLNEQNPHNKIIVHQMQEMNIAKKNNKSLFLCFE